MEKERMERMNTLSEMEKNGGLKPNEREELRILKMELLAESMPADDED